MDWRYSKFNFRTLCVYSILWIHITHFPHQFKSHDIVFVLVSGTKHHFCLTIDLGIREYPINTGAHYVVLSDYDVTCWAVLTDHSGYSTTGVGVTEWMSFIPFIFPVFQNYLNVFNSWTFVHVWQVSPPLSGDDTCQISMVTYQMT